jgi:molecular chaperone GrpE
MKENIEEEIVEDFVAEASSDEAGDELSMQDKIKKLKKELKEEQVKSKEYLDGWQRARADLVNKEKQLQADKLEIYKNANAGLLEDMIPVLDSYELARKNVQAWEAVEKNWRIGIEYIFTQLSSVVDSFGLKSVSPMTGDKFDIDKMSASEEVETDDEAKDHTVESLVQTGYELNGKLLREAKVKIWVKK